MVRKSVDFSQSLLRFQSRAPSEEAPREHSPGLSSQNQSLARTNSMFMSRISEMEARISTLVNENTRLLKRPTANFETKLRQIENTVMCKMNEIMECLVQVRQECGLAKNEDIQLFLRPTTSTPLDSPAIKARSDEGYIESQLGKKVNTDINSPDDSYHDVFELDTNLNFRKVPHFDDENNWEYEENRWQNDPKERSPEKNARDIPIEIKKGSLDNSNSYKEVPENSYNKEVSENSYKKEVPENSYKKEVSDNLKNTKITPFESISPSIDDTFVEENSDPIKTNHLSTISDKSFEIFQDQEEPEPVVKPERLDRKRRADSAVLNKTKMYKESISMDEKTERKPLGTVTNNVDRRTRKGRRSTRERNELSVFDFEE